MDEVTVLIVDDKKSDRFLLEFHIREWGFFPVAASSGSEAIEILKTNHVDLILSDMMMNGMDGLQLLNEIKARYNGIPFIIITAYGSIEKAVTSIKRGAYDYVLKPFNPDDLLATIQRSIQHQRLSRENKKLKEHLHNRYSFQNIITKSPVMMRVLKLAERVAKSPMTTIAIYGESGTGKEMLARAIHFAGESMENKFVAINCAGIPSTLLESELFGHVKGAFTGADRDREGKFDLARHGTLLLDEIGDIPFDIQAKLLRVLQERIYERLGSNTLVKADFRVIITTHKNLENLVKEGKFREDLYHRVNIFPIVLPPLRERRDDIPLLVDLFLDQFRNELGKKLPGISHAAMDILLKYHWPGNIRELKNSLERAVIMTDDELIRPEHLILAKRTADSDECGKFHMHITLNPDEISMDSIIKQVLELALERCGNNKSLAAEFLKVNRNIFYRRLLQQSGSQRKVE